jgi:sirohydrochlorin ferrochelatase
VAFLDHAGPRPGEALHTLAQAGWTTITVVPLLLTAAYHARHDLPTVLNHALTHTPTPLHLNITHVLGPHAGLVPTPLLTALHRRLTDTGTPYDAIVLAAAGTNDPTARTTIEHTARALGTRLGLPCTPAYASTTGPTPDQAIHTLRHTHNAHHIAMAAYFLAPGHLYDTAAHTARQAGATTIAHPLTDTPELAHLITHRIATAQPHTQPVTAA